MPAKRNRAPMKGIELPINTLVIVAVAVIILLGVVAFFMGGFSGASASIQKRQTFLNSCQPYTQSGCVGSPSQTIKENYAKWVLNKETVRQDEIKSYSDDVVKQACGCFGGTAGTAPTGGETGAGTDRPPLSLPGGPT